MQLDPRRLGVLATIARTGGVLAAASALHVTPSAVSQQLARLEREVGVALVVRSSRGVELTEVGVALAERGARIEAELAEAVADVAGLTRQVGGSVTVVGFPTAIAAIVAPAAGLLRTDHPAVSLRVLDVAEDAGLARLRAGSADLVVLERDAADLRPAPRGLRDVPLLDDPYVVVVPAGRSLPRARRGGGRTPAADLLALPWVSGPAGSATRSVLDRWARSAGHRPEIGHEALEFPAVLALVAADLGAALIPRLALPADGDPLARRIRSIALPGLGSRRILARHRAARADPSPATRVVLTALVASAVAGTAGA
jgi:DNA-binding transcriptional LysR family regulator